MTIQYKVGSTDKSISVFIQDSSVTTGAGLTGLVYNTANLTAYYTINNGSATQITLASLASATAAHTDGGFIARDGTNMPGIYRLDLPDAVLASVGEVVVHLKGATNMVPTPKELQVVANITSDVIAATTAIETDTQDIQSRLPAALVSGRIDASVGAMANNTITAAAAASDFGTEVGTAVWANGTRTLTAGTNIVLAKGTGITGFNDLSAAQVNAEVDTALSDVGLTTTITGRIDASISSRMATFSYTAPLDAAGTRTALGLGTANLDSQLTTIDSVVDAIKVVTDKLDTALILDGAVYQFTENALENAPSGGGGGSLTAEDVWTYETRVLTAGDNIVLAKGTGITGFNDLSAAEVNAEVDTALADYDGPTNAEMVARTLIAADYATASALATVDMVVDAIKVVTDKIDTALILDGSVYQFTTNALENAPSGSGATPQEIWEYNISSINTANMAATVLKSKASQSSVDVIDGIVDSILVDTDTTIPGLITNIPESVLLADWTSIGTTPPDYCLLHAAYALRCAFSTEATPGQYIVYKPDGTTPAWQRPLTTDPDAEPIVSTSGA